MIRINAHYFYRLATNLRPLANIKAGASVLDVYSELSDAEDELKFFLWNTLMPLDTSFADGHVLYQAIVKLTDDALRDAPIDYLEATQITSALSKFETVLAAEFARKDTFNVAKKGIYSTFELIEQAQNMFAPEIQQRIQDAIPDIKQTGRCLAFELPTAAAFHIFRAVESVSKQYVTVFRGTPPTGKSELGLGNHVRILRMTDADERVIDAVDQIRKLHRNPIMHPEQSLTMSEVQSLLGVAASAIQSMVADMERKAPTPDPALVEMLPDPDLLDPETEEEESDASSGSSSTGAAGTP